MVIERIYNLPDLRVQYHEQKCLDPLLPPCTGPGNW
jgi:hypothetical protein